jgi:16S rRNA (cytidine1402-2'-O)-methyltransferase
MKMAKLYIVSTPIGNLKDMTFRAIETLKLSDFIIAEDTRVTQNLLNHYDIETKLISYHKFNEKERRDSIIDMLKTGKTISLVTDAGTPLVSDPGYVITKACIENGIEVETIPGPSSVLSAVILSGFDPSKFYFYGFLSRKGGERKREILGFAKAGCPVVLFEAPLRVKGTLSEIRSELGDIRVAVVKELTKVYEKVFRGTISEVMPQLTEDIIKGEFVLVLDASSASAQPKEAAESAGDMISRLMKEGKTKSDAVKITAKELNLKKSDLYKIAHSK